MINRKIITIDEERCNGCGNCVTGCAEGALQIVNGKAKLVRETFCDGFGDCIGTCPTGALRIVEKQSEEFNFDKTIEHVRNIRGEDGVRNMHQAHATHEQKASAFQRPSGGCLGNIVMSFSKPGFASAAPVREAGVPTVMKSEISQWPLQLHLMPPKAPFLEGREMVILSTCAPVTSPDTHWRFIRGRSVAIACPKLDRTEGYVEKLAGIFSSNNIPRVIILRMEVPCCGGLTAIVRQALEVSSPKELLVDEVTMGLDGEIKETVRIRGREN